jgi:hypothetical protein
LKFVVRLQGPKNSVIQRPARRIGHLGCEQPRLELIDPKISCGKLPPPPGCDYTSGVVFPFQINLLTDLFQKKD